MTLDPEIQGSEITNLKGYPSLAAFIASDLDHSSVLYKRFDKLAARNILYLQSELVELERRQDELDREDLDDELAAKKAARDWTAFKDAATVVGSKAEERMELVMEIREKIKEYSKLKVDASRYPTRIDVDLRRSHHARLRNPLTPETF